MFNKKKSSKIDLMKLSEVERIKFLRTVKQHLREKAVEAKLWNQFNEAENLTINGENLSCEAVPLRGLSINDILKHI